MGITLVYIYIEDHAGSLILQFLRERGENMCTCARKKEKLVSVCVMKIINNNNTHRFTHCVSLVTRLLDCKQEVVVVRKSIRRILSEERRGSRKCIVFLQQVQCTLRKLLRRFSDNYFCDFIFTIEEALKKIQMRLGRNEVRDKALS